ncbi:MAG TPA: hypothetical protein VNZ06_03540 [Steroidobacteraceae bacterium]|nr:hypothetical protein [Steroidobacteraceae bacterium]
MGAVLDNAIELYRHAFRSCWVISLVGTVLTTAVRLRADMDMPNVSFGGKNLQQFGADLVQALQHMNGGVGSLLNNLLVLLLELVLYGSLFAQMHHVAAHARPLATLDALILGVRRLPGMVLSSVIFMVAVFVGFVLFLIPGFYLWGKLEFWVAAAFADDAGAIGGLGRSWEITTGNWWRSATAVTVALIIVVVLNSGADVVGLILLAFTHDLTTLLLVTQTFQGIAAVFVLPMLPAAALAIYYDLKLRREGDDLLIRANSLQTA